MRFQMAERSIEMFFNFLLRSLYPVPAKQVVESVP